MNPRDLPLAMPAASHSTKHTRNGPAAPANASTSASAQTGRSSYTNHPAESTPQRKPHDRHSPVRDLPIKTCVDRLHTTPLHQPDLPEPDHHRKLPLTNISKTKRRKAAEPQPDRHHRPQRHRTRRARPRHRPERARRSERTTRPGARRTRLAAQLRRIQCAHVHARRQPREHVPLAQVLEAVEFERTAA